jgi:hypothetical protein
MSIDERRSVAKEVLSKKNNVLIVNRLVGMGVIGIAALLVVAYVPGAYEVLMFGAVACMIPCMLFLALGLMDAATFESINIISKMRKEDFVAGLAS